MKEKSEDQIKLELQALENRVLKKPNIPTPEFPKPGPLRTISRPKASDYMPENIFESYTEYSKNRSKLAKEEWVIWRLILVGFVLSGLYGFYIAFRYL